MFDFTFSGLSGICFHWSLVFVFICSLFSQQRTDVNEGKEDQRRHYLTYEFLYHAYHKEVNHSKPRQIQVTRQ